MGKSFNLSDLSIGLMSKDVNNWVFRLIPWIINSIIVSYALFKPCAGCSDSTDGFWSPRTATMDYCESNYSHSFYVVELINSLTCIPMIVIPMLQMAVWKNKHCL